MHLEGQVREPSKLDPLFLLLLRQGGIKIRKQDPSLVQVTSYGTVERVHRRFLAEAKLDRCK